MKRNKIKSGEFKIAIIFFLVFSLFFIFNLVLSGICLDCYGEKGYSLTTDYHDHIYHGIKTKEIKAGSPYYECIKSFYENKENFCFRGRFAYKKGNFKEGDTVIFEEFWMYLFWKGHNRYTLRYLPPERFKRKGGEMDPGGLIKCGKGFSPEIEDFRFINGVKRDFPFSGTCNVACGAHKLCHGLKPGEKGVDDKGFEYQCDTHCQPVYECDPTDEKRFKVEIKEFSLDKEGNLVGKIRLSQTMGSKCKNTYIISVTMSLLWRGVLEIDKKEVELVGTVEKDVEIRKDRSFFEDQGIKDFTINLKIFKKEFIFHKLLYQDSFQFQLPPKKLKKPKDFYVTVSDVKKEKIEVGTDKITVKVVMDKDSAERIKKAFFSLKIEYKDGKVLSLDEEEANIRDAKGSSTDKIIEATFEDLSTHINESAEKIIITLRGKYCGYKICSRNEDFKEFEFRKKIEVVPKRGGGRGGGGGGGGEEKGQCSVTIHKFELTPSDVTTCPQTVTAKVKYSAENCGGNEKIIVVKSDNNKKICEISIGNGKYVEDACLFGVNGNDDGGEYKVLYNYQLLKSANLRVNCGGGGEEKGQCSVTLKKLEIDKNNCPNSIRVIVDYDAQNCGENDVIRIIGPDGSEKCRLNIGSYQKSCTINNPRDGEYKAVYGNESVSTKLSGCEKEEGGEGQCDYSNVKITAPSSVEKGESFTLKISGFKNCEGKKIKAECTYYGEYTGITIESHEKGPKEIPLYNIVSFYFDTGTWRAASFVCTAYIKINNEWKGVGKTVTVKIKEEEEKLGCCEFVHSSYYAECGMLTEEECKREGGVWYGIGSMCHSQYGAPGTLCEYVTYITALKSFEKEKERGLFDFFRCEKIPRGYKCTLGVNWEGYIWERPIFRLITNDKDALIFIKNYTYKNITWIVYSDKENIEFSVIGWYKGKMHILPKDMIQRFGVESKIAKSEKVIFDCPSKCKLGEKCECKIEGVDNGIIIFEGKPLIEDFVTTLSKKEFTPYLPALKSRDNKVYVTLLYEKDGKVFKKVERVRITTSRIFREIKLKRGWNLLALPVRGRVVENNCQIEEMFKIKGGKNYFSFFKMKRLRSLSPYYPYLIKTQNDCTIKIRTTRAYPQERYLKRMKNGFNIVFINDLTKGELLELLRRGGCLVANISSFTLKDRKGNEFETIKKNKYYVSFEKGDKPAIFEFDLENMRFKIAENIVPGKVYWIYLNNKCRVVS